MNKNKHTKNKAVRIVVPILLVLTIILTAGIIYINDYYHADNSVIAYLENGTNAVNISYGDYEEIIFQPKTENDLHAGFIFYPGGKVEYTAYAPLMNKLAKRGITCFLLKMPGNLAILDVNGNASTAIRKQYPSITKWVIGGHSLGGTVACMYLSKHSEDFDGLVLLASYSTKNLSDTDIDLLTIYGSNDKVLNAKRYEKNLSNLPDNFSEYVIEGGCHAYFGSYGKQTGDGEPTISPNAQQEITATKITEWTLNIK